MTSSSKPTRTSTWGTVALSDWPAYFEKITTMVASNSQLDIATIATEGMRLAAGNSFIIPLDPYLNTTSALQGYFNDVSPILKQVAIFGCNFWPIFSASKFKDQAWTFESFLLQPASIKALELRGANVAALRSVAYDPAFTTVPANNGKIWYKCVDRPDFAVQSVIAPPDFNLLDGIWSKALIAMVTKNGDISGNIAELQKNLEAMIAQRPASWASL